VLALLGHERGLAQITLGAGKLTVANTDGLILAWAASDPGSNAEFVTVDSSVPVTAPASFYSEDFTYRLRLMDADGQAQALLDGAGQVVTSVEQSVHVDFSEFVGWPFPLTVNVQRSHLLRPAGVLSQAGMFSAELTILRSGMFEQVCSSIPRPIYSLSGALKLGGVSASIHGFKDVHVSPGTQPVQLTMTFGAGDLTLTSDAAASFGDGPEVTLQLDSAGDAHLIGGILPAPASAAGTNTVGNVVCEIDNVVLTASGPRGYVLVHLPEGAGISPSISMLRMEAALAFVDAPLGPDFLPHSLLRDGTVYYCDESLPVWFEADQVVWAPPNPILFRSTGNTRFVRETTEQQFEDLGGIPGVPGDWRRRSNDLLYRALKMQAGSWIALQGLADGTGRTSLDGYFAAGAHRAHFPYDAQVKWAAGGTFVFRDGAVDPLQSSLASGDPILVPFARRCLGTDSGCDADVGVLPTPFVADSAVIQASRDGGLFARGQVPQGYSPSWGAVSLASGAVEVVHATAGYSGATLLVPGVFGWFETDAELDQRAAILLLKGLEEPNDQAPGIALEERPGTDPYLDGQASYAGLNFRQSPTGGATATSILAGQKTNPYPLSDASKLYVRYGGVNGTHVAKTGGLPSATQLYGYPLALSQFGFSVLESQVFKSITRGSLSVPYPAGFQLDFEELKFECNGALAAAKLPQGQPPVKLQYWNALITPLAMDFESPPGCDPAKGFLVMDVEAHASHVAQPLYGRLGFKPDGRLVSSADQVKGVTGRLAMPATVQVRGPGEEAYTVMVRSEAFFNSYDHAKSQPEPFGFLTFSGNLDLPFFQDIPVQVHTGAGKNDTTSPLHMAKPWQEGATTYATSPAFDAHNIGWPATQGTSLAGFRSGGAAGQYLPRARRKWMDVLQFDYPLAWSSVTRSFRSPAPLTTSLLVLQAEHQVRFMGAKSLDLAFGAEYSGLPKISIVSLGYNYIDEKTGVSAAFAKAISEQALNTLGKGLEAMQGLVGTDPGSLLTPAVVAALDEPCSVLAAQLKAIPASSGYKAQVLDLLGASYPAATYGALQSLAGPGGALSQRLAAELGKGVQALATLEALVAKGSGYLPVVALAKELLKTFAPAADTDSIDAVLPSVTAALEGSSQTVAGLKMALLKIQQSLDTGSDFAAELSQVLAANAGAAQAAAAKASAEAQQAFLKEVDPGVFALQEMTEAGVKALLITRAVSHVNGTAVAAGVQTVAKQRLYDLNASLRMAVDDTFQQVNLLLRAAVQQLTGQADQQFNNLLGSLPNLGAARVDGHAHINGDSLVELRLDAALSLPVPEPMEVQGYFRFRELTSDSPGGCSWQPGETAAEVTFGAKKVPLKFQPVPKVVGDFDLKFAFRKDPSFLPVGLAGGAKLYFDVNTSLLGLRPPELQVTAGFGLKENFLAGSFSGTMATGLGVGGADVQAGLFLGRTCSAAPITAFDPGAGGFLQNLETSGFTGIYGSGAAHTKFIDLGCLFNASAGVALRAYLTGSGAYGGLSGKASGELLCVVSATGNVSLAGGVQNHQPWLTGSAGMSAKVGVCPVCKKIGRNVGVWYKNGKFGGKL
jgi:hypothetical protein